MVLNDQDETSLILDRDDFDDEDNESYFLSIDIQPQYITPTDSSSASIQGLSDASPVLTFLTSVFGLIAPLVS